MTWPPEPTPYESPEHYIERCAAEIKRERRREEEEAAIRAVMHGLVCMCDEFDEDAVFTCDHQNRELVSRPFCNQEWQLCKVCWLKVIGAFDLVETFGWPAMTSLLDGKVPEW